MIVISCPSSRWNTHRERYNRRNDTPLIQMAIDENGVKFEMELTVSEAEELSKELLEWVDDIRGGENA